MVGILVVSHGPLAGELLTAASTINGSRPDSVRALCLDWDVDPAEALELVREAGRDIAGEDGLLILTDMYGGTPHNVARQLTRAGSVEVVSGVNLPMLVRLCCRSRHQRPLPELVDWITEKGKGSICHAPCVECG